MAKVIRTLREHWKKSTFAAVVGYLGIDYVYNRHRTFLMMREYSKEAQVHGKRKLPIGAKNKHITLLLNPTSGNRKAKGRLEKYAEPLLHLSGFLVNTVKTERIDEAMDLVGLIEKTNILAVAGGDGTLFETITGILRRDDADSAVSNYPIGVIPVGTQNKFAKRLLELPRDVSESKFIAEATMAIVNHKLRPADVMEIQIVQSDLPVIVAKEEGNDKPPPAPRKPFYSLIGINIGQFREAKKIQDEMPSFFGQFFTTFWSMLRVQPTTIKAELNYIPTCSGCSRCVVEKEQKSSVETSKTDISPQSYSIWSRIMNIFARPVLAAEIEESADERIALEENPECGVAKSLCINSSELNVQVNGDGKLLVEIGGRLGRTDFMIEGLKRLKGESPKYNQVLECREIELSPVEAPEFLSVDNEEFEVKKIKLKVIKDRINVFVPN